MNSIRMSQSHFTIQIRFGIAAAVGAYVIVAASITANAFQPPEQGIGEPPQIVTPYEPEMPPADFLLAGNVFGSSGWRAQMTLSMASADGSLGASFTGELINNSQGRASNHVLAATLQSKRSAERKLSIRITEESSIAWTDDRGGDDSAVLGQLAQGVYLLGMLVPLPGDAQSRTEIVGRYELVNLGIAKDSSGNSVYVVEAKLKDGKSPPTRISSLDVARILITFAVTDTLPRRMIAISAAGSSLDLNLGSITIESRGGPRVSKDPPPEDSLIIDLAANTAAATELQNPVPYDAESIARGKALYLADCVVCHSFDGTGRDSDVTDNAADLTNTEYWLSDGSDGATFLAIRDGAGDEMAGYKDDYRDDNKIWDLVNYMRLLQGSK